MYLINFYNSPILYPSPLAFGDMSDDPLEALVVMIMSFIKHKIDRVYITYYIESHNNSLILLKP
jgi:hypothetical protein